MKLNRRSSLSRFNLFHRKWRIALYSPGMVGLGHMRRNLLVAQNLAGTDLNSVILMIAEAREVGAFTLPAGVDCLSLPALKKETNGQQHPRYLDVTVRELVDLRINVIQSALESFEPDILIVDHLPQGAFQELLPVVQRLTANGHTRLVLGIRDILDKPETVMKEWLTSENMALLRNSYDFIWVYGDSSVYDVIREYKLPIDIAAKVRYTGYLDPRSRLRFADTSAESFLADLGLTPGTFVVCLVGGGQDGACLAEAFAATDLPDGLSGVIVSGPYMPKEKQKKLRSFAGKKSNIRFLQFLSEPAVLLSCANRVIAMGGYNTVCEMLSFQKPGLIVPRAKNRKEQLIRAERMQNLGLLDFLHPDDVTPQSLGQWLARPPRNISNIHRLIDFNGLKRITHLLEEVLSLPYPVAPLSKTNSI